MSPREKFEQIRREQERVLYETIAPALGIKVEQVWVVEDVFEIWQGSELQSSDTTYKFWHNEPPQGGDSKEHEASKEVVSPAAQKTTAPTTPEQIAYDSAAFADLQAMVKKLLLYMRGKNDVEIEKVCDAVWGEKDVTEAALKAAMKKANKFTGRNSLKKLSRQDGKIIWV